MNPLNITLVRQRYTPHGGAERFVSRTMGALRAQGVGVTLITRKWQAQEGILVLPCDPFYLGRLWRDWGFARRVCKTLQSVTGNLVQSHERIACCDIYRAGDGVHREWLKQWARVVSVPRRLQLLLSPYHRYVLSAERRLFLSPRLRMVICNSMMVKREIQENFGLPDHKIEVIYSGVDTQTFHPNLKALHRNTLRERYAIPEAATVFLFVGSGFARKGLGALLQAMSRLPLDSHLVVVGKDKNTKHYQLQSKRLGIEQRVHFMGPQADVTPFYGAADALVLPTLYDPFPNVALEAMASGLPLITSFKSGAADLIIDGRNGYVCDALDIDSLVSAMHSLLSRETAAAMGEAARVAVAPLTLENMGNRLIALYQRLLSNDASQPVLAETIPVSVD